MKLPILDKLKDGEKFDFETLADNVEQAEEYWQWWWANKADANRISRPEIISDNDPVLMETLHKSTADFAAHSEFFDKHLNRAIQTSWLSARDGFSRADFHAQVRQLLKGCSTILPGQAQLIFAGGGYGSGNEHTAIHGG